MTPNDVAVDRALALRFQSEVAYLDRIQPSAEEMREDAQLLRSNNGALVIAWLWPTRAYAPSTDPFAVAARGNPTRTGATTTDPSMPLDARQASRSTTGVTDGRRRRQRDLVARRFEQILEMTAAAIARSVEDLKTHLRWTLRVRESELHRLLSAGDPFSFPLIVELCTALQLEFAQVAWVVVDPNGLAQRIDESLLATAISDRLRTLSLNGLATVARSLPDQRAKTRQAPDAGAYHGPRPGGRYASLYEALAADIRDDPVYTVAEIDQLLTRAGETRLPESARVDRSWWAGNGARAEGRPQISAWWGAGYRIRDVATDRSGRLARITFEALPGRAQWLADPERTAVREYRLPGPTKVEVYPDAQFFEGLRKALTPLVGVFAVLGERYRASLPDDPDIRELDEFLYERGEADRSEIERHFARARDERVDAAWLTNLLTKARRQGWTVNNGTRRSPRWASTRLTTRMINAIAENWRVEADSITSGADPVRFLQRLAGAIGVDPSSNSAELGRRILESRGRNWEPEFESASGSVTGLGLRAIRDAIGMLMPPDDEIVVLDTR